MAQRLLGNRAACEVRAETARKEPSSAAYNCLGSNIRHRPEERAMSRLIRSIRFQAFLSILTAALLALPAEAVTPMRVVRPPVIPSAGVHGFGMPIARPPQMMPPVDPFMQRG